MARFRPEERRAWLREEEIPQADPLPLDPDDPRTQPYDRNAPNEYKMACTVSGRDGVFLITWRARDERDARTTFLRWLNEGWGVLSQTFWRVPGPYVFRTAAILGFVVLPPDQPVAR